MKPVPAKLVPAKAGSGEQESLDSRFLTDLPPEEMPVCAGMTTVYMTSGKSKERANSLTGLLKKAASAKKDDLLEIHLAESRSSRGGTSLDKSLENLPKLSH